MRMFAIALLIGCGGGGGTSGGPDAPQGPDNGGFVLLQHNVPDSARGQVDAGFWFGQAGCFSRGRAGGCEVLDCSLPLFPSPGFAGRIDVTGGSIPVFLEPQGGGYNSVQTNQPLFSGGETLTVAAMSGPDVPAFTTSVTAPTKATITAPVEPASSSPSLTITRALGFTVWWTGGSGELLIALAGGPSNTQRLTCTFDASAGTATIPADVLMALPTGAGTFSMDALAETSVTAGDFAVTVEGDYNAVWPDGASVSGPTMVQ